MPLEIGTLLDDRYRIEAILGQGGFGAVYLATDRDLGIQCAVKENLNTSPQAERQFRREATLLASLRHANLPRVTNHFVLGGHQYLVMDYVEGDDLKQRLEAGGALGEAEALRWVLQLCEALIYLHSLTPPVVHRDIKPGNVKITPQGEAVLVDFGIAKAGEAGQKTTTGAAALTSGYAPPEQYQMGSTDGRTDEYALAATLYHLLTGRIPPDSVERLIGQATLTPPEELRPDLSPNVAAALRKALEIRPDSRFPGVAAFRDALRDPDFRYVPAAEPTVEITRSAPTDEATAAARTQAAATAAAPPRPRTWRDVAAALALAMFCLVIIVWLAAGLAWFFIGPWELNNRALAFLGTPTQPPLHLFGAPQAVARTPYPTSSPYLSPTRTSPPTATPTRTLTPTPTPLFTPTSTPAPLPVSVDTAPGQGWRLFNRWQAGDLSVLAALSQDGETVAVYQPDIQGVEIFDAVTGESVQQLRSFLAGASLGRPLGLAYLNDSILVLYPDKVLRQDLAQNRAIPISAFFRPPARGIWASPDRRWVAVRAEYLSVYNVETRALYNLGDQNSQQAFAFSPDGRYLALAVGVNVDLYTLADGRLARTLSGRNKAVRGLAFTPDSARVVATSGDIWEAATGQRLSLILDTAADLAQMAVSPDGLVAVGSDGDVWELAGGRRVGSVRGLSAAAGQGVMAFIQEGRFLITHAPDAPIELWALDPNAAASEPASTAVAVATPDREPITRLNLSRLTEIESLEAGAGGVALSPDTTRAAVWSGSAITVVDLLSRTPVSTFTSRSAVRDAAFLGDEFLMVATANGVERWDIREAERKQDYAQTGRRLMASGAAGLFALQDKYIQVVDVASGRLKYNLGSADSGQPFTFTPDGRFLAIAARSAVALWDMGTGQQAPGQFGGHGPEITDMVFTPDGATLVAASGDVWDVASRRRRAAFDTQARSVAVSPDGQLVVGDDGTLWDAATGQYLGDLAVQAQRLAFAGDRTLLWQARDGRVSVYGIDKIRPHSRPASPSAVAPERLPLSPSTVVSVTVLGWWGPDPVLQRRLVDDPASPRAAVFGAATFGPLTLSPDGRSFTSLTRDGLVMVDPATGALVDEYRIFLNPETVIDAAYAGDQVLLLKERAGVERWDLEAQTLEQRYNVQGEGLVVSADGRWFALRQGNEVLVVDVETGEVTQRRRVQAGPQEYAFAPDNRTLAVSTGLFVELYDLETGQSAGRLRGRGARVFGLAFTPDGARLLAASGDAWTFPDGQPAYEQKFETSGARLAVSPDGALFVADDGSVWETAAGRRVMTLPELRAPAVQMLFTADNRQLLWRAADGRVYTWAARPPAAETPRSFGPAAVTVPNAPLLAIQNHIGRGRLLNAVWSPGDQYLAVNTTENVIIYEGATLERRLAFLDAVALAFDPQGRVLIGGETQNLRLVDVTTGQVVTDYQRTGIIAAAFSPDGARLVLGGRVSEGARLDGLAVIDPDGLVREFTRGTGAYSAFTRLEFTPDGRFLVASFPGVNVRGTISIWDVENASLVRAPIQGNALPAVISPEGRYLTYFTGARFIVESLERGGQLFTINADGSPFIEQSIDYPTKFPLAYSYLANGQLAVFYRDTSRRGGGVDTSVVLWSFDASSVRGAAGKFPTDKENRNLRGLIKLNLVRGWYVDDYARDREQHTPTFGLGPAGQRFYSLTGDGVVRVWSFDTGVELARTEPDSLPVMALSPDGRTLAVADALGAIELREAATGRLVRALAGEWYPAALAYSSDSLLIVLQAGRLSLVDVETGETVAAYSGDLYSQTRFLAVSPDGGAYALWGRAGNRNVVNVFSFLPDRPVLSVGSFASADYLRFAPDGQTLAVVKGRTVEVWRVATRELALTLQGQGRAVGALAFSPDGSRLYAASGEIWSLADGALIATFDPKQATAVEVTPNGQVLVGDNGYLWNAADGLETGALAGWRGPAARFLFTPDGERLIWQDQSGLIEVWGLGP